MSRYSNIEEAKEAAVKASKVPYSGLIYVNSYYPEDGYSVDTQTSNTIYVYYNGLLLSDLRK